MFQILGVVFAHLVGHNGRVGENIDPFPQKKLDGCRVDRNDSVDLYACIFAAKVIGKCMCIGGTAEPSNIQVLIIQLDVEQRVRTEGRADPLVGQLVSRVRAVLTVKDQNLFRLYCPPGPQGLRKRKG